MRTLLLILELITPEPKALRKNTHYHEMWDEENELIPWRCPAGRFHFMETLHKYLQMTWAPTSHLPTFSSNTMVPISFPGMGRGRSFAHFSQPSNNQVTSWLWWPELLAFLPPPSQEQWLTVLFPSINLSELTVPKIWQQAGAGSELRDRRVTVWNETQSCWACSRQTGAWLPPLKISETPSLEPSAFPKILATKCCLSAANESCEFNLSPGHKEVNIPK